MACDFTVAQDLARFGQAGPKHGSAPDGGSTDFLALFLGVEQAMESCTICEPWTAHKASRLGLLTELVPALKIDGEYVPNPMAITDRWIDPKSGKIVYGEAKTGAEKAAAKEQLAKGEIDLGALDEAVQATITRLTATMPDCLIKTIESVRKHKLAHWDKNRETNRAWLSLNMMTEAKAGFRAFHYRPGGKREVDFFALRQRLAEGATWNEALFRELGVDDESCEAADREAAGR